MVASRAGCGDSSGEEKKMLSEHESHLIAKALADPRCHEILREIGEGMETAACGDIRGCRFVIAATGSHL